MRYAPSTLLESPKINGRLIARTTHYSGQTHCLPNNVCRRVVIVAKLERRHSACLIQPTLGQTPLGAQARRGDVRIADGEANRN